MKYTSYFDSDVVNAFTSLEKCIYLCSPQQLELSVLKKKNDEGPVFLKIAGL